MAKRCSLCRVEKDLADFWKNQKYCKTCSKEHNKQYHKDNCVQIKEVKRVNYNTHWAREALQRASSRGRHSVGLTERDVLELYEQQQGLCYWLGIPLNPFAPPKHGQRPSIDRLDNAQGYTKSNVVITSWFANAGRNSMTQDEMTQFVTNILKIRKS